MSSDVKTANLLFKTHLDLGFTASAASVFNQYMKVFIPKAIDVASKLEEEGGSSRMIWTTGSWLIRQYLEKGDRKERRLMEKAILHGHISWHALPFTTHTELLNSELFRYGLSISAGLDKRFGRKTIGAKMTDVPGHTIAMIPFLAEAEIELLHIGVNASSSPPDVPDRFMWKHSDGSEIQVIYNKEDYGGDIVLGDQSFRFIHSHDNLGPCSSAAVKRAFNRAGRKWPDADVRAADLNGMAIAARFGRDALPVIEEEIGDTWIHGTASDPWKTVRFRALSRQVETLGDEEKDKLLCVAEHTWGMDEKTHLGDYFRYSGKQLASLRKTGKCRLFEASWKEQREYVADLADIMDDIIPQRPHTDGYVDVSEREFITDHFQIRFDSETGALSFLKENESERLWCSGDKRIGLFSYENFSSGDYRRFSRQYQRNMWKTFVWSIPDFRKPGMFLQRQPHTLRYGKMKRLLRKGNRFIAQLSMDGEGSPDEIFIFYHFPEGRKAVELELQWFDKKACRLPEASWFSFAFDGCLSEGWSFDKMGSDISPAQIVSRGARTLNGFEKGIRWRTDGESLSLESPDAHLVSFGARSLLDFHNRIDDAGRGFHINLHNNVWGTNFPMWFEEEGKFRFNLDLS